MLHAETPVPGRIAFFRFGKNIQDEVIGPVADGMHCNLKTGLIGSQHPSVQQVGISHQQTG